MPPRRLDDWLRARPGQGASSTEQVVVLGEVHDDRFAAAVTLSPTEVIVTVEGELEQTAVPVLAEVLDAAERFVERNGHLAPTLELDEADARLDTAEPVTALFLDARNVEFIDVPMLELLAVHRDRWEIAHGPCVLLLSDQAQRTWNAADTHAETAAPHPEVLAPHPADPSPDDGAPLEDGA